VAGRVYSTRFISVQGASPSAGYLVPAGMRAVVRFVTAACVGSPTSDCHLAVAANYTVRFSLPGADSSRQLEVRLVAYAGESIFFTAYGNEIRAHVSGFLFEDLGHRVAEAVEELRPEPEPPPPPLAAPP
jgi:hypothetical protein